MNTFLTNEQIAEMSGGLIEVAGNKRTNLIQIRTGLSELDYTIRGLTPGKLYVVGARPGEGKTSNCTTIAANSLNMYNFPALVMSTELTEREVWMQIVEAYKGGIPFHGHKEATPETKKQLQKAVSSVANCLQTGELSILFKTKLDEDIVRQAIDYHCDVRNNGRCSIVMIDQASRIARTDKEKHGYAIATEHMLNYLEGLAAEMDVPIVLFSQLNRQAHDVVPQMSHFKHSGAFEEYAHCCWLLHRGVLVPGTTGMHESSIIVAKNRHGPVKEIPAFFNGPGHTWTEDTSPNYKDR